MLSPSSISRLCALLLCLPLAIIFTFTTLPTPPSSFSANAPSGGFNTATAIHISNLTAGAKNPLPRSPVPLVKAFSKSHGNKETIGPLPVPLLPPPRLPPRKGSGLLSSPVHEAGGQEDDGDDDSLFQRASRVSPYPKPPVKKLAFMFLTTTPLPFAPLWELFFKHTPNNLYNIYIHADPSYNYTSPFRGVFAERVIPSKPTRRHSPTLIAAARRLLSQALLHDKSNYMFALLSPACIPLRSFNFTYKILTKSRKSFIEILKNEPGAYYRWAARGEEVMAPEVKFEDFRIGSQFFVVKRKHARIVASDRRLWSKFKLPCLWLETCYPEEHYFPTLLRMVDPHGCVPATLTHVDWRRGHGGHPRMYGRSEVGPELIRTLRKRRPRYGVEGSNASDAFLRKRRDPFLFARKFSADSIEPLMDMANDVIFKV